MSGSDQHKPVLPSYGDGQDGAYMLPDNDEDHERLAKQADFLSILMNDEVIHAPLDRSTTELRFLDIGCGTGIVTDVFGARFKDAEVYGLDLTPPPATRERLPNVHFLQGNVSSQKPSEWTAADDTHPLTKDEDLFDLAYGRLLICGLTDWPGFIHSQIRLLKPGGYLEIQDIDWKWFGRLADDQDSDSWRWWLKMGESMGRDYSCGSKCQQWMKDAGFVDVTVKEYRWPWGAVGQPTPEMQAFGGFSSATIPELYWDASMELLGDASATEEKIQGMLEDFRKDFTLEPGQYMKLFVTVGRKPL